jgi:tetratricopeptide (TPR) repeat protein
VSLGLLVAASARAALQAAPAEGTVDRLHAEAKAAEARGDVATAIARYESIVQQAPRLGPAYNNLGALYVRTGDFAKAAAVLEKGLTVDPTMASAQALLGFARYQMGAYAESRGPLEAAVKANPKDDHARTMLANTLVKLSEWEAAAAHLQQLSRHKPKDQETWYLLGTVYMRLSEQALARLGEIDPDSALMHQISGEVMESMKNYDGALVEYRKALEKSPGRAGVHYKIGNVYWATSQWEAAAQELEAELKNDAANCLAHWKLGNILLEQNLRPEEAVGDIDKALALCPNLTQARADRGRALLKLGRHDEAVRELLAAEKASPEEPRVHFFLAQAYRGLGRAQDAVAEMQIFAKLQETERAAVAKRAEEVSKLKEQQQR